MENKFKTRTNMKSMLKKICFVALLALTITTAGCKRDPDAEYKVVYMGNGNTYGFAPTDNEHYLYGEKVVVKEKGTLLKEGYTFKNWNTKQHGDGDSYNGGDTLIIKGAVFLYAIWE